MNVQIIRMGAVEYHIITETGGEARIRRVAALLAADVLDTVNLRDGRVMLGDVAICDDEDFA
jgi:hypothetical protein